MDEKIIDKVFEQKSRYNNDVDFNFVMSGELTVTITLNEYRELVSKSATSHHDVNKANSEKYDLQKKLEAVTAERDALKDKLVAVVSGVGNGDD